MTIPQPSQWVSSLPSEQLQHLRSSLLEALSQHQARLDSEVDPHDIAAIVQRRSERARDEILGALDRLDDGTYGCCVRCNASIPLERLTAVPHTPHCTACARIDGGR